MRLVAVLGLFVSCSAFGQGLARLHPGQHLRIAMVGQGPLCEAALESITGVDVSLRLTGNTIECGTQGSIVTIAKQSIYQVAVQHRLTKRRVALKILASLGAVAALAAIPLTSSDPESWLLLGNVVIPAFAAVAAWKVVPNGRQYALLILCPDRFHCFSSPHPVQKESLAIPDGTSAATIQQNP